MVSGPPTGGICIFCGQKRKLSDEHIWGDWLKKHVPARMQRHRLGTTRINPPGIADTSATRFRTGDPLRSNLKVVCIPCNTGWLSRIQDAAKPLLLPLIGGKACELDGTAQARAAAWCCMATMTAEYISRDPGAVAVMQTHRDWLMQHGTPPPGWRVWIADYVRGDWPAQWVHFSLPITDQPSLDDTAHPNTQVTTFVIGRLFVHAMSSDDEQNIARWAEGFADRHPGVVQLFPAITVPIIWPPTSIGDRDADNAAGAFQKYIDYISRNPSGQRIW